MPKKANTKTNEFPYMAIASSAAIGLGVILLLLLLFSLLLSVQDISQSMIAPITVLMLLLGGMVGGYRCGHLLRKNGFLIGVLTGALQYLILLLISLALPQNEVGISVLYKLMLIVVSSAIGSIIAVNRRTKVKQSRLTRRS